MTHQNCLAEGQRKAEGWSIKRKTQAWRLTCGDNRSQDVDRVSDKQRDGRRGRGGGEIKTETESTEVGEPATECFQGA